MKKLTILLILTLSVYYINAQKNVFLVKNVHVIPMNKEQILKNQNVLIEEGIIKSISTNIPKDISSKAIIINGEGKYLIPGMLDAHAHLPGSQGLNMEFSDYFTMMLANGVTSLRCMRYEPTYLALKDSLTKANAIIPNLYLSSPMIGVGVDEDYYFDYTNARELIPQFKQQGYSHLKYLNGLNPKVHQGLCKIAEEHDLPLVGHLPMYIGLDYAMKAGQRGIEHFHAYVNLAEKTEELDKYITETHEKEIYNCPTIFWYEANYPFLALETLKQQEGFEYLPTSMVDKWEKEYIKYQEEVKKSGKPREKTNKRKIVLERFKDTKAALLVSPGDGDYVIPGFSYLQELKIYKEAGLSPYKILEATSKNAALFYKDNTWGSIEEGKKADLVLLNKNPLEDITNIQYQNITGVFINKHWLDKKYFKKKLKAIQKKNKKK